jgi:predicted RNA binding protein YcfA (HicA-like mRNA interferase family)
MVRKTFSGREIAKVLRNHGYERAGRTGSHLRLRWESPDSDEVRIVSVPMTSEGEIPTGTLHSIADECGAEDFAAWCRWIDENC